MALHKCVESTVRRRAGREGYLIRKSRRAISYENQGEYMLVEISTNIPALGFHYDATLGEIAEFLEDEPEPENIGWRDSPTTHLPHASDR